ncbi:Enoyl-CoA hydratase carnithine racemase [Aureococcus anophagefferens]|uniref:3-hydroxyisobutyryl-CoA hydrolase n=1 Tax=Aureococcus anophagefferens TaxID=44056 RepID=A0ABR1FH86_AURAN
MSASGVRTSLAPNGVVQVELDRGGKLNALNRPMWEAIADAVETSPDAPLVITSADPKAFSAGGDVTAIAGGPPKDVVDFLHLEYATLDALRERRNTIAVSDGIVMGAGAGVFMACATRVVTERARFAMPEVRIALVPDAGALRFLSKHCEPAVARFLAVTGYNLNAHDLVACGLATHFAKRDQLAPLLEELAAAPAGELAVPVDRRCVGQAPAHLATPLFVEASLAALRSVFGGERCADVAAIDEKLAAARLEARGLLGSVGWQTREIAEQVLDLLDVAHAALAAAPPRALQATLDALDAVLAEARTSDDDVALARFGAKVELAANAVLGTAPDFAEGRLRRRRPPREAPAWRPRDPAPRAALLDLGASLDDVRDAALAKL